MNLTLSKRGDYVVRAALSLARAYPSGTYRKIREVVAEMDVPATFASQILADLVHAGLASSKAGKGGGYRLLRSPEEINVLEVVEAGEGPLRAERCALGEGPCRWESVCPLHETWGKATSALRDALAATPLAELVARDRAIEEGTYAPPADSHRHVATSVTVSDHVLVELPYAVVQTRLRKVEGILAAAISEAYVEADEIRRRLDPGGLTWAVAGSVAVSLGAPEPVAAAGGGGGPAAAKSNDTAVGPDGGASVAVSLCWEQPQVGGAILPSRFEGRVVVRALDPQRCSLELDGWIRPPIGPSGEPEGDRDLRERLAQVTVRSLLRQVARDVEDAPGSRRGPSTVLASAG
ncbi:MAG: Rrf2 family transcriptional regulator [Actinomycetota bacterium]|nr:Rrf2 family transcriptional regulator [Actinomycetota bacterium]